MKEFFKRLLKSKQKQGENKMKLSNEGAGQQAAISKLQNRVSSLSDKLADLEHQHERFKEQVSKDMNKIIKVIYKKGEK